MSALKLRSSVLIVQHPHPSDVAFGADFAVDFASAAQQIREYAYQVVVLPSDPAAGQTALTFLDELNAIAPLTQRVVIQNQTTPEDLRRVVNKGNVFKILANYQDPQFEQTIMEALEEYNLIRQNTKLLSLVNEQNESLRRLNTELEDRVEKRQKFLEDARRRLLATNHRVEGLHNALVAVHQASSVAEMERVTTEALKSALGLSWIRVLFRSQSQFESESQISRQMPIAALYHVPLSDGREEFGKIYFARESGAAFSKDETAFLTQIADAVSLAIGRLTKLEQSEALKHQWEATFDAILDPVCLVDSRFTVQRINRAFADRSGVEAARIIGRKCHEVLFGRSVPCENCHIGSNFRLKPARTRGGHNSVYEVFSQAIRFKPRDTELFVNMYHDISAQLRLERQILEGAKMAELGVIGSSIAHELNNPLGGMLSFLQLVRMDLKGDEPYREDIAEMEQGALRCSEIIKNLLGFTRKSTSEDPRLIDLREVVEQGLKITELQTRAIGIRVRTEFPTEPVTIKGQFNYLAQAIRNILQNAQEAIAERMRAFTVSMTTSRPAQRPGSAGGRPSSTTENEIFVRIISDAQTHRLIISDNGVGFAREMADRLCDPLYTTKDPERNPGLGLTLALQVIRDHNGILEISSQPDKGTSVQVVLPRLESSS